MVFNFFFQVNDFVFISDHAYAREQVLVMEKAVLDKLEWYLTVPTPYVFLVRYIKASISFGDDKVEFYYFYHFVLKFFFTIG